MRLIEEPHNGQVMFVEDKHTSHFIPDETKAFREEYKLEELFTSMAKGVAEKM